MFDVTKSIDELEQSGFTQEQARASLTQWIKLMNDNLTTKIEMKELEFSLRSDMKELETSLRSDMKELRSDLNHLGYRVDNVEFQIKELRSEMRKGFENVYSMMKWTLGLGVPTMISLFAGIYFKLFFG